MGKNEEDKRRYGLYCEMIEQLDEGCRLINEYDSIPHDYGTATLYQAESQLIHLVGEYPGDYSSGIGLHTEKNAQCLLSADSEATEKRVDETGEK